MKTPPVSALIVMFVLATAVTSLALAYANRESASAGFLVRWWSHAWQHGWAAGAAVVLVALLLKR
jgi:hypothetical protein